jgi:hypothetical protein
MTTRKYGIVNEGDFIGDDGGCPAIVRLYREDDKELYEEKIAILQTPELAERVLKMLCSKED